MYLCASSDYPERNVRKILNTFVHMALLSFFDSFILNTEQQIRYEDRKLKSHTSTGIINKKLIFHTV